MAELAGSARRLPAPPALMRALLVGAGLAVAGLAGCGSGAGDEPESLPPASQPETVLLEVATTTGPAEPITFRANPGDLWIGGECVGGELMLHIEPVAVLPIPCDPDGQPFRNQIVMREPTEIRLTVVAADSVTWSLVVEQ